MMGIFYEEDETESDEEYAAWFERTFKEMVVPKFELNDTRNRLMEQASALGKACRLKIKKEYEKVGLTEADVQFTDIKVY